MNRNKEKGFHLDLWFATMQIDLQFFKKPKKGIANDAQELEKKARLFFAQHHYIHFPCLHTKWWPHTKAFVFCPYKTGHTEVLLNIVPNLSHHTAR